MLLGVLTEEVQAWQTIFGGGPLAAFIGILLVACVTLFWFYVRANRRVSQEQTEHLATVRETVALTVAMEHTWREQLQKDEEATALQSKTVDTLSRAVLLLEWAHKEMQEQRKAL